MSQLREAVLLVNGKSRRGRDLYDAAHLRLVDAGFHFHKAGAFRQMDQLLGLVDDAIRSEIPLIVVGGGDGTLSSVAQKLIGTNATLGVLPLGTGNAFARDLGISPDLNLALPVIMSGETRMVDLGQANGSVFVNIASVGLTTEIAKSLDPTLKRTLGKAAYIAAVWRALARVKPFWVTLSTENGLAKFETLQVVIGCGRFHAGPFQLSEAASIDSGKLSLYALQTARKSALLKLALNLTFGHHGRLEEVHTEETAGGTLRTDPKRKVTVDGEISQRTPLEFKILPAALRVLVPHSADISPMSEQSV
jgi:YegS/Rv2252/BmrU family lipid kinase